MSQWNGDEYGGDEYGDEYHDTYTDNSLDALNDVVGSLLDVNIAPNSRRDSNLPVSLSQQQLIDEERQRKVLAAAKANSSSSNTFNPRQSTFDNSHTPYTDAPSHQAASHLSHTATTASQSNTALPHTQSQQSSSTPTKNPTPVAAASSAHGSYAFAIPVEEEEEEGLYDSPSQHTETLVSSTTSLPVPSSSTSSSSSSSSTSTTAPIIPPDDYVTAVYPFPLLLVPMELRVDLISCVPSSSTSFESSSALKLLGADDAKQHVYKEGFMNKMGGSYKSWKTRYFRLLPGRLNYYKDGEGGDRMGTILLCGATLSVFSPQTHQGHDICFGITPVDLQREYIIEADNISDRTAWLEAIKPHTKCGMQYNKWSTKEGYMVKLGGKVKNWKTRYFIYHQHSEEIRYYPDHLDMHHCLGTIQLHTGFSVASVEADAQSYGADKKHIWSLQVAGHERTYIFVTNTAEEKENWIKLMNELARIQKLRSANP